MKCKICKADNAKLPDQLCDDCLSGVDALISKMLEINKRMMGIIHPSQAWSKQEDP